jgi:hypothetical protein
MVQNPTSPVLTASFHLLYVGTDALLHLCSHPCLFFFSFYGVLHVVVTDFKAHTYIQNRASIKSLASNDILPFCGLEIIKAVSQQLLVIASLICLSGIMQIMEPNRPAEICLPPPLLHPTPKLSCFESSCI